MEKSFIGRVIYSSMGFIGRKLRKMGYHLARPYTWNPIIHHIPLYFYFLWLLPRYRGWTFLYCNPSIDYSGFLNESKTEIYARLSGDHELLETDLIHRHDSVDVKLAKLDLFLEKPEIDFPIVLKPDRGLRSYAVKIISDIKGAREYIKRAEFDVEMQEFCDFNYELLVFFYRDPRDQSCHIYSTGLKTPPIVVGDGKQTVRQLLLADMKYVAAAQQMQKNKRVDWEQILSVGEQLRVSDVYKQSQGCQHVDGSHLMSEKLHQWVDSVTAPMSGFNVGRFDIKFRDFDSIRRVENLKILELNGGAAVATLFNRFPLVFLNEYYTMFRTWNLVFWIGFHHYKSESKVSNFKFLSDVFKMRKFIKKLINIQNL